MNKIILLALFIFSSLNAGTISIAVASNVSYAIEDLKREFNLLHPNTKVKVTLGSSGKLTAQIKHGAPYQLFMSANMLYPQALYEDNLTTTKPLIYAKGTLAYLSTKKMDFSNGIDILNSKEISNIAMANPKTAPYGKATLQAMKSANIYENIKKKLVYGESISQTLSYTIKATDIGIVAKSLLYSKRMKGYKKGINWMDVDTKLFSPISQGIVILKDGSENSEVEEFYKFIFSKKAKEIFKRFGYIVNE